MKKILIFLSFTAVMLVSCDPLSKTYKEVDAVAAATPQVIVLNLTTSYSSSSLASTGIISTLNSSYGSVADGSTASVTYVAPANSTFAPDVTLSHVAYTVTTADYAFAGSKYTDFSDANALAFLAYLYPTPVANQQVVLTYNYYLSGYTASSGTLTTDTFVYIGSSWVKAYTVSPTQYASVSRGLTNTFISADVANIPSYLGGFLKADGSVTLAAKAGDVKYVSYRYATTSNYILPMYYDGTNWSSTPTLTFIKSNGTWQPQPIVNYTLTSADITIIVNGAAGSASAKSNLSSYKDFSSAWSVADMNAAIIECLLVDFPNPTAGTIYKVTFNNYSSPAPNPSSFLWDGTKWVPKQS